MVPSTLVLVEKEVVDWKGWRRGEEEEEQEVGRSAKGGHLQQIRRLDMCIDGGGGGRLVSTPNP